MVASLIKIEPQAASQVHSDVGRHLEIVDGCKIFKRDLIRFLDQNP